MTRSAAACLAFDAGVVGAPPAAADELAAVVVVAGVEGLHVESGVLVDLGYTDSLYRLD